MALDMSSEELRAHLFRSLQERGVLDSLKVRQTADTTPALSTACRHHINYALLLTAPPSHTHTHSHTCTPHTHTPAQSHLRNRLATELQKSLGSGSSAPPTPVTSSMTLQVANNIVAEHLKKAGYEYSLSVFLPEAGVDSGRVSGRGSSLTRHSQRQV